jgi:hypothetical protein
MRDIIRGILEVDSDWRVTRPFRRLRLLVDNLKLDSRSSLWLNVFPRGANAEGGTVIVRSGVSTPPAIRTTFLSSLELLPLIIEVRFSSRNVGALTRRRL